MRPIAGLYFKNLTSGAKDSVRSKQIIIIFFFLLKKCPQLEITKLYALEGFVVNASDSMRGENLCRVDNFKTILH